MAGYLLDVNVLIALMWPSHEGHKHVRPWFHRNAGDGWATCPFTEAAFVRIVSNGTCSLTQWSRKKPSSFWRGI